MKCLYSLALLLTLALTPTACVDQGQQSATKDDPAATSNLKVLVQKSGSSVALAVSVPSGVESMFICESPDLASCATKAQADRIPLTKQTGGAAGTEKSIYAPSSPLKFDTAYTLNAVRSGKVVESRSVKITLKNGTASTTTTSSSATASATSTGGKGGSQGKNTQTFSFGGSNREYIINVPKTTGPYGLIVFLHGSTASNYKEFVDDVATVAANHNAITVSVLAPNGQGWNEPSPSMQAHAEGLDAMIRTDIFTKYDINPSKVYFVGQSSGSGFLSSDFLAQAGANYGGGAILFCGGQGLTQPVKGDLKAKKFRMHYHITTEDNTWKDYDVSVACFRKAGLTVSVSNSTPGSHCSFMGQAPQLLDQVLQAWEKDQDAPGAENPKVTRPCNL